MTPKKLEPKSRYAEYDADGDGTVTDEELTKHTEIIQLELQEEKATSQKKWHGLRWFLCAALLCFLLLLLSQTVALTLLLR